MIGRAVSPATAMLVVPFVSSAPPLIAMYFLETALLELQATVAIPRSPTLPWYCSTASNAPRRPLTRCWADVDSLLQVTAPLLMFADPTCSTPVAAAAPPTPVSATNMAALDMTTAPDGRLNFTLRIGPLLLLDVTLHFPTARHRSVTERYPCD